MNTYVGFRYVPLFCGKWDNSKGYEALSVVTHILPLIMLALLFGLTLHGTEQHNIYRHYI